MQVGLSYIQFNWLRMGMATTRGWKEGWEYIKKRKLDVAIFIYCTIGVILAPKEIPCGNYIMAVTSVIFVIFGCTQNSRLAEYYKFFIKENNETTLSKSAGWLVLISCFLFLMLLFSVNILLNIVTYWIAFLFALSVLISSVLTIFDLEKEKNSKAIGIRVIVFSVIPLIYMLTSSYSASLFLQISNLNITLSPWLEYCWKSAAFLMLFLMLSQPFCYGLFLAFSDKAKGYRIFTLFGALMTSIFLAVLIPSLLGGVAYYVLNSAINSEWHSKAKCGQLTISNPWERYFGFNTEKYTVFYSFRNGMWGFEEFTCKKRPNGDDYYIIESLPTNNIPKWLR